MQGISDLITVPGEVNVDFADVKTIMTGMGMALMGTGIAKGENRAVEAAQRAISSPLLEETSIEGAQGVLLNISGSHDLTLHEVAESARIIAEAVDPDANIISGMVIDEELGDEMKVTVIATGFDRAAERTEAPAEVRSAVEAWRPRPSQPQPQPVIEASPPAPRHTAEVVEPAAPAPVPVPAAAMHARPMPESAPPPATEEQEQEQEQIPFYRKVLANRQADDPGGYGPNWSNVDDYDIPTVLRKQMD